MEKWVKVVKKINKIGDRKSKQRVIMTVVDTCGSLIISEVTGTSYNKSYSMGSFNINNYNCELGCLGINLSVYDKDFNPKGMSEKYFMESFDIILNNLISTEGGVHADIICDGYCDEGKIPSIEKFITEATRSKSGRLILSNYIVPDWIIGAF